MVKRGDLILVNLDPSIGSEQSKIRPAIVIQHDALNAYSSTTIIVPISSTIHQRIYPMHVLISGYGLKKDGTIKVEQIRCVDKSRIVKIKGHVSDEILQRIGLALQYTCDFF